MVMDLSPFVPAYSLGQDVLRGEHFRDHPVSTLMAAAYPSHITFFSDIRELPARVVRVAGRWTALQGWDPRTGRGALLALRQDASARERRIRLRNVPPGGRFELIRAPGGQRVAAGGSARLRRGLRVEIGRPRGARVLLIRPARERRGPERRRNPSFRG